MIGEPSEHFRANAQEDLFFCLSWRGKSRLSELFPGVIAVVNMHLCGMDEDLTIVGFCENLKFIENKPVAKRSLSGMQGYQERRLNTDCSGGSSLPPPRLNFEPDRLTPPRSRYAVSGSFHGAPTRS